MSTTTTPHRRPAPEPGFRFRDLGKMMGGGQSTGRQFGILGSLIVIILIFQVWTGG
jgi:putative multiple sugar transport system permease protein